MVRGETAGIIGGILIFCLIVGAIFAAIFGWGMNVYKLCKADFEAPYKNEWIRSIGCAIPPVGVVVGYMNINDGVREIVIGDVVIEVEDNR